MRRAAVHPVPMTRKAILSLLVLLAGHDLLNAQIVMTPFPTFGGGDAWLAPGEPNDPSGNPNTFLGTNNFERGLAFNAATDHLYLVSRPNTANGNTLFVRILDALTGQDVGALDTDVSIIFGGFTGFPLNMIGVAADGAIYGANLTVNTSTAPFKVYRWDNETSPPVNVYVGNPEPLSIRVGDSFDVFGAGLQTRVTSGLNSPPANPTLPDANGFTIVDPNSGLNTDVRFVGTPPDNGDFRLGMTFIDSDTVLGGVNTNVRLSSFNGNAAVLDATLTLTNANERSFDFAVVGGVPLLATVETGSQATASTVRVYDMTTPATPVLVSSGRTTTGAVVANANGTGQVKWGEITGNTATLYAMNTNNGIQAFTVTIPEPSTGAFLALAGALIAYRRKTASAAKRSAAML